MPKIGPRAGSCNPEDLERYIIRTVHSAPTGQELMSRGRKFTQPEPLPSNRQVGVVPRLIGNVPQLEFSPFKISIKAMEPGRMPTRYRSHLDVRTRRMVESGLRRGLFTVDEAIRRIQAKTRHIPVEVAPERSLSTQRFGVKRDGIDFDFVGVTENFVRWPSSGAAIPSKPNPSASGVWQVLDIQMVKDPSTGRPLLIYLSHDDSSPRRADIGIYRFGDLSLDPVTSFSASNSGQFLNDAVGIAGSYLTFHALSATMMGRELIVFVLGARISIDSEFGTGRVYSLRFRDETLKLAHTRAARTDALFKLGQSVDRGILSACETPNGAMLAVALVCPGFCSVTDQRTIVFMHTPDLTTWGSATQESTLAPPDDSTRVLPFPTSQTSLSEFSTVALGDNVRFSSVHGFDRFVHAVTLDGRIYRSEDTGRTFRRQYSPVDSRGMTSGTGMRLYAVYTISADHAYAVGEGGTILQYKDWGGTIGLAWRVVRYTGDKSQFGPRSLASDTLAPAGKSAGALRAIAVKSALEIWCAGDAGTILYSGNGGTTWTEIVNHSSNGSYTTIVYTEGNTVVALGTEGVHENQIFNSNDPVAEPRRWRALQRTVVAHINNATTAKALDSVDITRHVSSVSFVGAIAFPGIGGSNILAMTTWGEIFKWDGNTWSKVNEIPGVTVSGNTIRGFFALDAQIAFAVTHAAGGNSYMWRTQNLGSANAVWRRLNVPIAQASTVYFDSEDVGVIGGYGLVSATAILHHRGYPSLLALPTGTIILACVNLTIGRIEVWRATGFSNQFALVDDSIRFEPQLESSNLLQPQVPRPSLTQLWTGDVLLSAASYLPPPTLSLGDTSGGVITNGQYGYRYTRLFDDGSETTISDNVSITVTGGPRKVNVTVTPSSVPGVRTRIYRTRVNSSGPYYLVATIVGTLSSYVDNTSDASIQNNKQAPEPDIVRVSPAQSDGTQWLPSRSSALPLPVGNLEPEEPFTGQVTVTTRTVFAQSFDGRIYTVAAGQPANGIAVWIAWDFAVQSISNPTHFLPIINDRPIWIGYSGLRILWRGMPAIDDEYVTKQDYDYAWRNLLEESPRIEWRSISTGAVNIIWDREVAQEEYPEKVWDVTAAALFRTNFENCYLGLSDNGINWNEQSGSSVIDTGTGTSPSGPITSVIIDETKNWIPHCFKAGGLREYYLKNTDTDIVYRILDNGRNYLQIANTASLGTSIQYAILSDRMLITMPEQHHFGRYLRIRIPAQGTADGYFRIGTAIIGNYVTFERYAGKEARRRFSAGFGWGIETAAERRHGISLVGHTEHFGMRQTWTLPYESIWWHDRDMILAGLVPKMHQAFALQFDGSDPQSIELVRITDAVDVRNTVGDRYSMIMELEEVR